MIDFDVVTGPGPSEKPREPEPKRASHPPASTVGATLPRATLLPRTSIPGPNEDAKSRP
jgi:hypothetical protein